MLSLDPAFQEPWKSTEFIDETHNEYRSMGNWQVIVIGRSPNLTTKPHFMHYGKTQLWSWQGKQSTREGDDQGNQEQGR
jgi:hypothetical protein